MKIETDKDVINELGFGYADLMDIFNVSKQRAYDYLRGDGKPSTDALFRVALERVGELEGQMANRLLALREIDPPCVCLLSIGDNGPCPKHLEAVTA